MTRTVFRGGLVFDGTGSEPSPADVTVEDGRWVPIPASRRTKGTCASSR